MSLINAHILRYRDKAFVFDIGRTTAAKASAAFIIGLEAYQKGGYNEAFLLLKSRFDETVAGTICQQIEQMLESGWFAPFPQPETSFYSNPTLHLSLSRQSNLASKALTYQNECNMSPEIVSRAVALSFQTVAKAAPFVEIHVGETGDPIKNVPALARLFELAAQDNNVAFGILTCDGTQDVRPIGLAKGMQVCFEIGGTPEIQDEHWPLADGSPSSGLVERNIRAWMASAGTNRAIARVRITGVQTEVSDVYEYLYRLGFRKIRLAPLRSGPEPYAIDETNVGKIMAGYDSFVGKLLGMDDDLLVSHLNALWGPDFLGRFIVSLLTHTGGVSSCPAGKAGLSVDADGKIYACSRFSGMAEYCLGSVRDGLDENGRWVYLDELLVDRRNDCSTCWTRYLCGGGCCHSAAVKNHNLKTPDRAHCELIRHVASLAIWLLDELQCNRPQVLQSLLCKELRPSLQTGLRCPLSNVPISEKKQILEHGLVLGFDKSEQRYGRVGRFPAGFDCKCFMMADEQHLHVYVEIFGSAFKPAGAVDKSDFVMLRFVNQPNNNVIGWQVNKLADYYIAGDPPCLMASTAMLSEGVSLQCAKLDTSNRRGYLLHLPWSTIKYQSRSTGVFGFNAQVGIKSQGEEFGMRSFPRSQIGIITLAGGLAGDAPP
jgi:uncharacterized protein